MPRKPAPKPPVKPTTIFQRTPVAEWVAGGIGLVLTLGVIGVSVMEAMTASDGPPDLSVQTGRVTRGAAGHVVEIAVRNASFQTAADVEIEGRLESAAGVEERSVTFPYVPARGTVRGGLGFASDPKGGRLSFSVVGYADP
jgi:uncharacterized protein (TIGR02588 family)